MSKLISIVSDGLHTSIIIRSSNSIKITSNEVNLINKGEC